MSVIDSRGVANMSLAIWTLVGASLILAFGGYLGTAPSETAATGTVISTWSLSGPSWAAEVSPDRAYPVRNGDASSQNGGLFRVRFPFNSSGWYNVELHLLNLGEVSDAYEDFRICIGAAPAPEEHGRIVKDNEMFLDVARAWSITRPACSLISPEDPYIDFDVDSLFGTVVDSADRSANYMGASDPVWRVIDIGVVDGGFRAGNGNTHIPLRLHMNVEPK